MGKASRGKEVARIGRPDRARLLELLDENLEFLNLSATSYDEGYEAEAKRLAVTIRVLLHDTDLSHSLLNQLRVKEKLLFTDTALHEAPGRIQMGPGLAMLKFTSGEGGEYVPMLDNLSPTRIQPPLPFAGWWQSSILMGTGPSWTRKKLVLELANKEGGAHVDPKLNAAYEALANHNALGWTANTGSGPEPFKGSPVSASVRQIAYEVTDTIRRHASRFKQPSRA
jgi:hypothetical protein